MPSRSSSLRFAIHLAVALGATFAQAGSNAPKVRPIDEVNPFVGTDGHGHTFPGAMVPFGMVQLSPDTRTDTWDGCSGYHYSDKTIQGFSHTHLSGTGCGCLGDIMVMPEVGDAHFDLGTPGNGYISRFSHDQETAQVGYYKVFLQDPKVTAEMTATERVGLHKYTFPASASAHLIVDLLHGIQNDATQTYLKVENSTTISGYRKSSGWGGSRTAFFVMQFSRPFDSVTLQNDGSVLTGGAKEALGKVKALVNYSTKAGESIEVKVALSGTGIEGARKNLKAELSGWDFNKVKSAAQAKWSEALGSIEGESANPHTLRTLYTNLYQSYQAPTLFNDHDGAYLGLDHKVHTNPGFNNYTEFSLWDTHRAFHPLATLLQPKRVSDFVSSLLAEYKESGYHSTPIWPLWGNETWCMIGYHSVPVIVDAYFKGFKGFDPEVAYRAMRDTAMQNRNGLATYKENGWVASRSGEQATSKTLEYGIDDWCLARMATALGHLDDAKIFYARAANYRNIFDQTTTFMRGRKADGSWRSPFDTIGMVGDEYTEADAWQYAFAVPQDVPGMISTYGGDAGFVKKLDALFVQDPEIHTNIPDITGMIGQYSQGDEQCHHVAYLYDYVGQPWKTQQRVRQALSEMYNDTPTGQCGNVDCGQMSSWYVLSALGIYEVNPGSGVYEIGSPTLNKMTLHLESTKFGKKNFTMIADGNNDQNIYIQSATWNGKPFNRTYLTHDEIIGGGTLHLVMGATPNTNWGTASDSRPPATMPADFKYAALPAPSTKKLVAFNLPIRIVCGNDDPVANFIPDPNDVGGATSRSDNSVETTVPNAAPSEVYQYERYGKDFSYTFKVPTDKAYTVRLHFAEVFDDEVGMRIENIYLNGEKVLADFDVRAAAGGANKAVVKEFKNLKPDAHGNITVRIQATPESPDQNAKISAIEIIN